MNLPFSLSESISRMKPDGFLRYLQSNLKNTWGDAKGKNAIVERINGVQDRNKQKDKDKNLKT